MFNPVLHPNTVRGLLRRFAEGMNYGGVITPTSSYLPMDPRLTGYLSKITSNFQEIVFYSPSRGKILINIVDGTTRYIHCILGDTSFQFTFYAYIVGERLIPVMQFRTTHVTNGVGYYEISFVGMGDKINIIRKVGNEEHIILNDVASPVEWRSLLLEDIFNIITGDSSRISFQNLIYGLDSYVNHVGNQIPKV